MSGHRIIGDGSFLFGEIVNVDFLNESEEQILEELNNNNFTVYMHISPSGKRYIGMTSMLPEKRWRNGE